MHCKFHRDKKGLGLQVKIESAITNCVNLIVSNFNFLLMAQFFINEKIHVRCKKLSWKVIFTVSQSTYKNKLIHMQKKHKSRVYRSSLIATVFARVLSTGLLSFFSKGIENTRKCETICVHKYIIIPAYIRHRASLSQLRNFRHT